jgi:hypothetical protein
VKKSPRRCSSCWESPLQPSGLRRAQREEDPRVPDRMRHSPVGLRRRGSRRGFAMNVFAPNPTRRIGGLLLWICVSSLIATGCAKKKPPAQVEEMRQRSVTEDPAVRRIPERLAGSRRRGRPAPHAAGG